MAGEARSQPGARTEMANIINRCALHHGWRVKETAFSLGTVDGDCRRQGNVRAELPVRP